METILNDDAMKVLHSVWQQIWKTQQWTQDWKRSVFISIPKKGSAKKCSNHCTIALISHVTKVMLKILETTLQQYMSCELSDVPAGFSKIRVVQFSHSVLSDSLRPHESQHARPPCPSPTPRVHSNARPSSQ